MSTQVFTLANQLTILRMLLVPVFVLLTLYGRSGWALLTFMFAGMTDLLDGLAARKTSGKTDLGAWLDPIADKLLIGATFVVLTLPNIGRYGDQSRRRHPAHRRDREPRDWSPHLPPVTTRQIGDRDLRAVVRGGDVLQLPRSSLGLGHRGDLDVTGRDHRVVGGLRLAPGQDHQ